MYYISFMLAFGLGFTFSFRSLAAILRKEEHYLAWAMLGGISFGLGIAMFASVFT